MADVYKMFHSNSVPENLGPVWGVHIWHDNSGASPEWYLAEVVVSEVSAVSCLSIGRSLGLVDGRSQHSLSHR